MSNENYIGVFFIDEKPLMEAVKKLIDAKERIIDVRSPFPVHGLDKALSIRRTKIPVGGFIFGVLGAVSAFTFMAWIFTVSYPLIIGGKPYFSVPTFIPITFECTILFSGLSMAAALLIRSKLKPDIYFAPDDVNITDDLFEIIIDNSNGDTSIEKIRSTLSGIEVSRIE
jgi:hypothetical protein